MDPITAAALAALAGSIGSEAGRNAWLGLTALVRRPFRRSAALEEAQADGALAVSSGEVEAAALEGAPDDPVHAQALATALHVRAALDAEFRALLDDWWRQARTETGGNVQNNISGTVNGTAVQGRDHSNFTFHMTRTTTPADQDVTGRS
ncbi:hypothetical protein HHL19_17825 [Streptomyces sp. R302]|uniref:hypothetical protein n=1 Tax=unclassified Streptomyces TaxID=2593676 RepID=UPI00145F0E53|nr:hypothetical protein [Streptomyces sp. R301]NML80492.1 hypothetical protein [Streptomyces sp. R302]